MHGEVLFGAEFFRYYAEEARRNYDILVLSSNDVKNYVVKKTRRHSCGNYSFKLSPAAMLCPGTDRRACTMPETPLTALHLAQFTRLIPFQAS